MSSKFLDSNIILRYLLDDPQALSIENLLKTTQGLVLPDIVFAEVIWTLTRFYKWEKNKVVSLSSGLLDLKNISANKNLLLKSLEIYKRSNIKYTDAYIAALMSGNGSKDIYSFDRDFDRIPSIKRMEPK